MRVWSTCCATAQDPPFALERPAQTNDPQVLVYQLPKPLPDGRTELVLSTVELLDRLAALIPPPLEQHTVGRDRASARYLWAMRFARIYDVFPARLSALRHRDAHRGLRDRCGLGHPRA